MSEGAQTSPNVASARSTSDASQHLAGGMIVAFAAITLGLSIIHNPSAALFGTTLEPRIVSILMGVLGVLVIMRKVRVRGPQDFYGGVALVALSVIALLATADLQGMRGFAFGPATAPRLFSGLLAALGGLVAISGLTADGPSTDRYDVRAPLMWSMAYFLFHYASGIVWQGIAIALALLGVVLAVLGLRDPERHTLVRGPVFLIISILVFAETIRPLGLVLATFLTVLASAAAAEDVKWHQTVIWGVILTVFCSLLFPYGLNLPFQLWPKFWY